MDEKDVQSSSSKNTPFQDLIRVKPEAPDSSSVGLSGAFGKRMAPEHRAVVVPKVREFNFATKGTSSAMKE